MKKIGIFGGVFNPPHNFHFTVAQEILNLDKTFEKIFFVPVGNKYKKSELIDAEHRHNMLKIMCDDNNSFDVSRIEIDANEQHYAYQTLDEFSKEYPSQSLYFIIGTDSLKTLHTWANLDYLLTKYHFLVYKRDNDDFYEILSNIPELKKYKNNIIFANNIITSNLSSTYIRTQLSQNKNVNYLLPKKISDYINKNNLYKIKE